MILASCSTIPERKHFLLDAVNSIKKYVDRVVVNCGYTDVFKNFDNVTFVPHNFRIPDQYKFKVDLSGIDYHLTFDDDILYPKDYVYKHLDMQERFGYDVTCVHGSIFTKSPITNFFKDRIVFHFKFDCVSRTVNIPGTGTLCYQPKKISFPLDYFENDNMSDVFVGIKCKKEGKSIAMLGRHANWTKENLKFLETPDLYNTYIDNHAIQTELVNRVEWR